jgi:hypothetical protein
MAAFFFSFFHQIKNKRIFSTSASSNIFEKTIGPSVTAEHVLQMEDGGVYEPDLS